jgi:predicted transcriptional regulator
MSPSPEPALSRRERQLLDILYRKGEAGAKDVRAAMDDAPSYSAVRATLRILEQKGHVEHRRDGARYVYRPRRPQRRARRSALQRVVDTFFGGSAEEAFVALLDIDGGRLDDAEYERLRKRLEERRGGER